MNSFIVSLYVPNETNFSGNTSRLFFVRPRLVYTIQYTVMETTASNKLLGIKNIMGTYIKYIHSTVIYKMTHILNGNKKYTF